MTTLNKLFENYVKTKHGVDGGVVTTAAIADAYEIFLGLTGNFSARDQRIAYWEAKNISAENFAELFLKEAEELNAENAATFEETQGNRKVVVSAALEAAKTGGIDEIKDKVAAVVGSQPGEGEQPGVPGETFSLTSGAEVVRPATEEDVRDEEGNLVAVEGVQFATENDDTINGVTDNLASRRTLDQTDSIDGGEGNNKLEVTLNANFNGFTGAGSMTNVQTVELTNDSNFSRTFNSAGTQGIDTYILNSGKARIDLTNIQSVEDLTVQINGQKEGQVNIGFASNVVSGQEDSINLNLNNLGTAAAGTACSPVAAKEVTLNAAGVEHLNITATGSNIAALGSNTGTKTITVDGAGDLGLSGLANSVTSFDASANTGAVNASLATTNSRLTEVKFSQDESTISASAAGLNTVANIEGSASSLSTFNITAAASKTLALTMNNVETLGATVTNASTKLTFSGEEVFALERVNYGGAGDLTLANMQTEALLLQLNAASAGEVVYDGFGELNVQTQTQAPVDCPDSAQRGEKAVNTSSADVVAANAQNVTFDVLKYSSYNGVIQANAAEVVTLNVASTIALKDFGGSTKEGEELSFFAGTLQAANANQLIIDAKGDLGAVTYTDGEFSAWGDAAELEVGQATSMQAAVGNGIVNLSAPALEELSFTAVAGAFRIDAGSNLQALASLNANGVSGLLSIERDLQSLQQASFVGTGSVDLTGSSFTDGAADALTATDDSGTFDGFATAGDGEVGAESENVELNASGLVGGFAVNVADAADGSEGGTVTITGSRIGNNNIEVGEGRETITVSGGVSEDLIVVNMDVETTSVTLTGGAGRDIFEINNATADGVIITITDFVVGTDTLEGTAKFDGFTHTDGDADAGFTAANAKAALEAFSGFSNINEASLKAVILAIDGDGTTKEAAGILYNNNVYLVDKGDEDAGVLVELQGLASYEVIDWFVTP